MSQIHAVTQSVEGGSVHCTLSLPKEVIERMNTAEDRLGEQEGAAYRDRVLQVLAAMVIQSIDAFRVSGMCEPVGYVKVEGELPKREDTNGN